MAEDPPAPDRDDAPARRALVDDVVARLGASQSVALRGPAGIGKTTLVRRVVAALADRRIGVLRAVTSETSQRLPMGALAGILATPFAGTAVERMVAAIATVRATGAATVLVVDDAHLLDDESAAAVHHVAAAGLVPVLASVRSEAPWPDAVRRLWRDGLALALEVPPLAFDEGTALLERALGGVADVGTARRFVEACEGNPLLLQELVTATRAERLLRRTNGIWSADVLADGSSTRDLLDARVARFDDELRRTAELVAVGGAVPRRLLAAIAGDGAIGRAEHAKVVRERDSDGLIETNHQLLADAVRRTLDAEAVVLRLRQLVTAATDGGPDAADLVVPVALWMLALEDRHAADPALLWAAADRSMDRLRLELAEQLAEAAVRAGGGSRARDLLVRIRANQGKPVADEQLTPDERRQRAQGMAEAFLIGLGPFEGVRAALADAAALLPPGPERAHVEALDLHVAMTVGPPTAVALDRMQAIMRAHAGATVARVAAMRPAEVLGDAGRFDDALALMDEAEGGAVPTNEFHRYQLGHSRALALLRAGRPDEAGRVLAGRLGGSDAPTAAVFRAVVSVEIALAAGRPAEATVEARRILAVLGAIDAAGLRTWSLAALGYAVAWETGDGAGGDGADGGDDDIAGDEVALQARPQATASALLRCQRKAVLGRLADARRGALALAERAERDERWFWALRALHLGATLDPAAWMPERAAALAARCQSEWGRLLGDHVGALVAGDAAALEKVAAGFERVGQLALALDAYAAAAEAHRGAGQRAAVVRCRTAEVRLRVDGVADGRAHSRETAALTRREREVVALAARGTSNRVIAGELGLSMRTVETHLQRAYRKLGVNDRAALPARPAARPGPRA